MTRNSSAVLCFVLLIASGCGRHGQPSGREERLVSRLAEHAGAGVGLIDGPTRCAALVLDKSAGKTFAWVYCKQLHAKDAAEVSLPVVVDSKGSILVPSDGAYEEDIKKWFPRHLQHRVLTRDVDIDPLVEAVDHPKSHRSS